MRPSAASAVMCAVALTAPGSALAVCTPSARSPTAIDVSNDASKQGFRATVRAIDNTVAEMTSVSWREGCPVALADLRLIELTHHDFAGQQQVGELVVHRDVAREVARAFRHLYRAGFPIRSMRRVDAFAGNDDASMAADNTSAFNCRAKTGGSTSWSVHSYGRAIDINPVENPYVRGTTVLPPAGRAFVDRTDIRPGMIVAGDAATASLPGMAWGDHWATLKDYQHLERPASPTPYET